mmetsp:Transcript_63054/g.123874  ORF Transcript_63054/g.123874 Transcript_63054/m.123874 type:complete len:128 (+) Transcript_63054:449-832(+)
MCFFLVSLLLLLLPILPEKKAAWASFLSTSAVIITAVIIGIAIITTIIAIIAATNTELTVEATLSLSGGSSCRRPDFLTPPCHHGLSVPVFSLVQALALPPFSQITQAGAKEVCSGGKCFVRSGAVQ